MAKKYLSKNVYALANERIEFALNDFKHFYVSLSGGKDSGVLLELVLDIAKKRNIKVYCLIIDLEGHYQEHVNYLLRVYEKNKDFLVYYWVCLPLSLRNAVSQFEHKWFCWDKDKKEKWIREIPRKDFIIHEDNNNFKWFRKAMEFEEFIILFAKDFCEKFKVEKVACFVGIRADESMNRYRTIVSEKKTRYKNKGYTTLIKAIKDKYVYNFYPIYDWKVEDIWHYVSKFKKDYNKIYDLMYLKGRSIHDMRICQPYGDDQKKGLDLFHECEFESWEKVVRRVSGVNFGALYRGDKILGNYSIDLPKDHTYKSYALILLNSMPSFMRGHYLRRINVFLGWYDDENLCKDDNECIYVNKKVSDFEDLKSESKKLKPSWRRICKVLIKNDFYCKGLSFTQNKNEYEKLENLKEKYKDL